MHIVKHYTDKLYFLFKQNLIILSSVPTISITSSGSTGIVRWTVNCIRSILHKKQWKIIKNIHWYFSLPARRISQEGFWRFLILKMSVMVWLLFIYCAEDLILSIFEQKNKVFLLKWKWIKIVVSGDWV